MSAFGIFFLDLRQARRISTIFLVKVRSWVRYVFLITCWVMVLPPWFTWPPCLTKARPAAEGCDPVYTAMALKAAVLLGNIAVLQVHADLTDIYILIMACINKPDLFSVLVINEGIREHGKIGPFHLRQFVIGDLTALIQLRLCFCIRSEGRPIAMIIRPAVITDSMP